MMTTGEKMIWALAYVSTGGDDVAAAAEESAERVTLARHAAKRADLQVSGMALAMLREMVGEGPPPPDQVAQLQHRIDELEKLPSVAEEDLLWLRDVCVEQYGATRDTDRMVKAVVQGTLFRLGSALAAVREHVERVLRHEVAPDAEWYAKLHKLVRAKP